MGARIQILTLTICISLTACSIYQSKGRKFLEGNAYQFARVSAFAESCGDMESQSAWREIERSDKVIVYQMSESDGFRLQIADLSGARSCLYKFTSEKQLKEYLNPAVEYTLLNFSLGEFAFRH